MKTAVIACALILVGCLPNSAIVPEYRGADAARLVVFNDHNAESQPYLEVDGLIVCRLPSGERNEVMVSPGRHRVEPKVVGSYPSIPLIVTLAAGETRYLKAWNSAYHNGLAIEEISEAEYGKLIAPFIIKSNFGGTAK